MVIKSLQTLVSETLKEIKTINADEAFQMVQDKNCNLIDLSLIHISEPTRRAIIW